VRLIRHIDERFAILSFEQKCSSSVLYRLHVVYSNNNNRSAETFLSFMEKLSKDEVQIDRLKKAEILEEGDQSIYENVMKESYSFYDHASLFGITLRSRGLNYREMYEAVEEKGNYGAQLKSYIPHNNQLASTWHNKKEYSSWLKFQEKDGQSYAQANTFFRFKLPLDQLLHGTAIASICTWNISKNIQKAFNVNQICLNAKNIYDRNCRFVPLVSVYSTAVAILPLDKLYKPYNVYPVRATNENSRHFSDTNKEDVEFLLLIDLQPERFEVRADNGGSNDSCYRRFEQM